MVDISEQKFNITSSIDYDDLSIYGIEVSVEDTNGDVSISRNGREILTVKHTEQGIEIKRRINGKMETVVNDILGKIQKYMAFLSKEKIEEVKEEMDTFFHSMICNNGYHTDEMNIYKYDLDVQKQFFDFFLKYVKLRFGQAYKEELENPFFEEIELQLISIDLDYPKNKGIYDQFKEAQFFSYTRQNYKNRQKIK